MLRFGLLFTLLFTLPTTQLFAAENQVFSSNNQATTFLELYTSQGCNNCPPAERWLSELSQSEQLWTSIIPINFHVDYWDYLGWKDPFALAEFSQRQRRYAALGLTHQVATPGFIINGRGWNGWFSKSSLPAPSKLSSNELNATLSGDDLAITVIAPKPQEYIAHIAILGFGIQTPVTRGENKGKTLKHDFVVIGYKHHAVILKSPNIDESSAMKKMEYQQNITTKLPKVLEYEGNETRRALVIWLSAKNNPAALQVTAGWI